MALSDTGIPAGLDCPVCLDEVMTPPIYQCDNGHSLCHQCYSQIRPKICPSCRQAINRTPNIGMQNLIEKLQLPCLHKEDGCKMMVKAVEKYNNLGHVQECIFRTLKCPFAVLEECTWTGKLKNMMNHCKACHITSCHFNPNQETVLEDINFQSEEQLIRIFAIRDRIFFLTCKIDPTAGQAYWAVQHYASKDFARTWVYHLEVISTYDSARKLKFIERCFYDVKNTDEIFTSLECAVVPLSYLKTFVRNDELKFNFKVLNLTYVPKNSLPI